jgi:hypothetical protein
MVETMFVNARFTRNWPETPEQLTEAERQIRMAMYQRALGEISEEERDRVLAILRPCVPDLFAPPAPIHNEWESLAMAEPPVE